MNNKMKRVCPKQSLCRASLSADRNITGGRVDPDLICAAAGSVGIAV